MALLGDFEELKGSIFHHSLLPSIDSVVNKLLAEEMHLKSHSEKGIPSSLNPYVLAIPSKLPSNNHNRTYIRVTFDECSFCKQKGHWKAQCPKSRNQNQLQQQNQTWKLERLSKHSPMLIDHLRATNHHSLIL